MGRCRLSRSRAGSHDWYVCILIDIVLENKILDVSILMSELYIRFRWSPLVLFWSEYRRRRTNVRSPRYVRCVAMIYIHSSLNYFCHLFSFDVELLLWAGYIVILGLSSFYFCLAAISLRWVKKLEAGEEEK